MSALDFRISSAHLTDDAYVVSVGGEVDLFTAPQLEAHLSDLDERGARRVVVDLAAASFIDSSILSLLLSTLASLERTGGKLIIVTDDRRVLSVFELGGLDGVFRLVPSLTEAVETMIDAPIELA